MPAVEWQTLLLVLVTYAGWLAVTRAYALWPLWLVAPLAVVLVTLHSSLQHEILHGHPTRWAGANNLLAIVPLSLWLPYKRYQQLHLKHHHDDRLTDPIDDPESFYWTAERWAALGGVSHVALRIQQTLAGRVLLGSFWRIGMFLHHELRALRDDAPGVRRIWLEHLLWCIPVIAWITLVCHMPLWIYVLAIVVPARGMVLIRAFAEHRARPAVRHRIAIVEKSWLLGPLFLYNNLHSLHHEKPAVPWYQYNERYRRERERLIADNGGLVYVTYFDVARRFLFRPHDVLLHPCGRVPTDPAQ
ncbi:MAG TPA: fatty acid desaturase [Steroidobacteraceae bacterium]|nr:fatty acid desaturase [Steroidobacteraceae bacterium]